MSTIPVFGNAEIADLLSKRSTGATGRNVLHANAPVASCAVHRCLRTIEVLLLMTANQTTLSHGKSLAEHERKQRSTDAQVKSMSL
jgi:hypothetical protein